MMRYRSKDNQNSKLREISNFYSNYNYPDGGDKRKNYWINHLRKHIDFKSLKGKKVLDVGCGQGTISSILHEAGANVYAIDLSKTSVDYVKKHYPKVKAKLGNVLDLSFKDQTFDMVISIGVLHHTPDVYRAFEECARVLKKGGQAIILLYTKYHYYPLVYKAGKFLFRNRKPSEVPKPLIKATKRFTEWYYGEKRTDADAIQLIADQLFTPIARFHSKGEIIRWGKLNGLKYLGTSTTYFGQHRIWNFNKVK